MTLTEEQKRNYYRNKKVAQVMVMQDAAEDEHVIYGEHAVKVQLPSYLHRETEDFDVFAKNPKKEAKEMEKKLDKTYGGDFFSVKPAKHKGTYKVKSNVTKRTVVDYTKIPKKLKTTKIGSNTYVKLGSIKNQIKKTLKNEKAKFRHDQDFETLQRIRLGEDLW